MDEFLCAYCQASIPSKALFCPKCAHQLKCKECKEPLELDANACMYCGTATSEVQIVDKGQSPLLNHIEFNETKTTRQLKASFTDQVGESFGGILSQILLHGAVNSKGISRKFDKTPSVEDIEAEVIHENNKKESRETDENGLEARALNEGVSPEQQDLKLILKIFRFDGDKVALIDSRLKATSKIDFCKRLIVLYLYANTLQGKASVLRSNVTKLLEDAGLNNPNTRVWIANNNCTRSDDETKTMELIIPGLEEAKRYLGEVNNPDIENKWLITTQPKHRKKAKKSELENESEGDD